MTSEICQIESSKMVDSKYLIILVLTIINCTRCEINHSIHKRVSEINHSIHKRVSEIKNKSREMYGEVRRGYAKRGYELDKLMYPRGNKHKLSALSQAWRDYYGCSVSQLDAVNDDQMAENNVIVMVFQGATARLPCRLCTEPGQMQHTWQYSQSALHGKFTVLQNYDRLRLQDGVMTIYNAVPGDEGVFWCRQGAGFGGLVFIEVVDKEPYTVVKPLGSRGPNAVATEVYQGIILYTQWSPWSECSVCGKVGRRHRHGICYVKLDQDLIASFVVDPVKAAQRYQLIELDDKLVELFQTFPDGLPCRSQYLPKIMSELDMIKQRPSEIMIGMCKVPCKGKRRKRYDEEWSIDDTGTVVYPVKQPLPKQPPLPVRDTIFAEFGERIVLRCPGTTLRDVPMQWRVGTKHLVPRDVDKSSGGRVHLNCRDHLVFTRALYTDDNLYSCWQRDNLAGTVKLIVWQGAHARWDHRVMLVLLVALFAVALQGAEHVLKVLRRYRSYT